MGLVSVYDYALMFRKIFVLFDESISWAKIYKYSIQNEKPIIIIQNVNI